MFISHVLLLQLWWLAAQSHPTKIAIWDTILLCAKNRPKTEMGCKENATCKVFMQKKQKRTRRVQQQGNHTGIYNFNTGCLKMVLNRDWFALFWGGVKNIRSSTPSISPIYDNAKHSLKHKSLKKKTYAYGLAFHHQYRHVQDVFFKATKIEGFSWQKTMFR